MKFCKMLSRLALVIGLSTLCSGKAEAAFNPGFYITVTPLGGPSITVYDGGVGDADGVINNQIDAHSWGTLGLTGYVITMDSTTFSPTLSSDQAVNTNLRVTRLAGSVASIQILIVSDGFTVPAPFVMENAFSASSNFRNAGGTTKSFSTASTTVPAFSISTSPVTELTSSGASGATNSVSVPSIGTPFTITQQIDFVDLSTTNNNGPTPPAALDFNGALNTNLSIVPVPPALALLASGLPVAGLALLRRRRKA